MTTFGDLHTCGKCNYHVEGGNGFTKTRLDDEHEAHLCTWCLFDLSRVDARPNHGLVTRYDRPPQGRMHIEGHSGVTSFVTLPTHTVRKAKFEE